MNTSTTSKVALGVIFTGLAALASYALLATLGPGWARYAPATCLATHCFCEVPRTGALILQPANSWSSFGFVLVGFWTMLVAGKRGSLPFSGFPVIWFALSAIFIGVGSFLLHATLTLWGQFFDVLGMYLFSAFTLTYSIRRWRDHGPMLSAAIYVVLCAILVSFLIAIPETRRWLFAVVLVADIAIELIFARPKRPNVKVGWFAGGIALQALAFTIWILDLTRTLCSGSSLLQGHAIWHLLNACAVYCQYLYYRSERALSSPVLSYSDNAR